MSNFQQKYKNWQERMSKKSEREKHNIAITISFGMAAVVLFFMASNWYFEISGNGFDTSFFTDLENSINEQKQNLTTDYNVLQTQKDSFMQTVSGKQTVVASSTGQ